MKIIIFGAPGSGKGTQAKLISKQYNLKHISTGDLLRSEVLKKSEIGIEIGKIISEGKLVSDELIWSVLKPNLNHNYILDGYPRTKEQIPNVIDIIDFLIFLDVDHDLCVKRIVSRKHARCDDNLEIAKKRMKIFLETSDDIKKIFLDSNKLIEIDGNSEPENVFNNIIEALNSRK